MKSENKSSPSQVLTQLCFPFQTKKVRLRMIGAYIPEPLYDQIRELAESEHTTLQSMVTQGLSFLLESRGEQPVKIERAPIGRPRKPHKVTTGPL